MPAEFADWQCEVVALEMERSFWEKATILHAEDRPTPDRFSRHYADTVALAQNSATESAIVDHALRKRVVAWKSRFFGSAWARYDLASVGTFRVVPPDARIPALRRDYESMREMYLSRPMAFDDLLLGLARLEKRINRMAD